MSFYINVDGLFALLEGKSIKISDGIHPTEIEVSLNYEAQKILNDLIAKKKDSAEDDSYTSLPLKIAKTILVRFKHIGKMPPLPYKDR